MELLAVTGASLVWNARLRISVDAAAHCNCKSFGEITVRRRRWNPFPFGVDKRGGSGVAAKQTVDDARGFNAQAVFNSASETIPSSTNKRDRIMATRKEYQRNVSRLATTDGDVVDRETSQPGGIVITPRQTGRVRGLRAARRSFDEEDYATANLRHSQLKPAAANMRAGAPSALTSIALAAIPILFIAPVMGFTARCVVDFIHSHIEQEVGKRFAELESWQARRRPRVKRWQTILDEDRDEDELEPLTATAIPEYQYESDPWSMNARHLTTSKDASEMESWHEEETEEQRKLRHRYAYEQMKRSYSKLEPMYEKFLVDSGLSASGYWRAAGES